MTSNVGKQEEEKDVLFEEAYSLLGTGDDESFFVHRLMELRSSYDDWPETDGTMGFYKIVTMLCHVLHRLTAALYPKVSEKYIGEHSL